MAPRITILYGPSAPAVRELQPRLTQRMQPRQLHLALLHLIQINATSIGIMFGIMVAIHVLIHATGVDLVELKHMAIIVREQIQRMVQGRALQLGRHHAY